MVYHDKQTDKLGISNCSFAHGKLSNKFAVLLHTIETPLSRRTMACTQMFGPDKSHIEYMRCENVHCSEGNHLCLPPSNDVNKGQGQGHNTQGQDHSHMFPQHYR